MEDERSCAKLGRVRHAFADCRDNFAKKANTFIKVRPRRNDGLANIGGKADKKRTASMQGNNDLVVPCFAQQSLELWADILEPCVNSLGAERLACPVDKPSPRRVKPGDPAKIKHDLPGLAAVRDQRICPRLDGRRGIHRPAAGKGEA